MSVQLVHKYVLAALSGCLLLNGLVGCAPRVAHKDLAEDQVGLAVLQEDGVRKVVFGPQIQGYVSQYPIFAEVVNNEILKDLGGYVGAYNVYAREPLQYTETGLKEVDPFLLRAAKVSATVRVGTRLMNYIGLRLKNLDHLECATKADTEVYYSMTPEELSLSVQHVRDLKGTLSPEAKRALAKDIVALAADMEAITAAAQAAKGLLVEGENLKGMLTSSAYAAELQSQDAGRSKLLPEIVSNVNGAIAGVRSAGVDGESIARNARAWEIYLADALQ